MQPVWVLHRRPFKDSGLLVDVFSAEKGRYSVLARGAHRKTRGGNPAQLLQPFTPLLLTVYGKGELQTCRHIEAVGPSRSLAGPALFSGLYVNELLVRLLHRFDPHPRLFAGYAELLDGLASELDEAELRRFELLLLSELGYEMAFTHDAAGATFSPDTAYVFSSDAGFQPGVFVGAESANTVSGGTLININSWIDGGGDLTQESLRQLKRLTRRALGDLLGERPLQSRALMRAYLGGEPASSAVAEPLATGHEGIES